MTRLRFDIGRKGILEFNADRLVVAGWTGRDAAAIQHHIEELVAIGVPRPSTLPLYYRVACAQLSQEPMVEVLGETSSGEVEPVLLRAEGRWWLTVGSDHTDRVVEAYAVDVSKQLCPKPLARQAWAWDELADRADALLLCSEIEEGGQWVLYQQGTLAQIRPLASLVLGLPADVPVKDGLVLFCGTVPALPDAQGRGVRPALRMRMQLVDPVGGRCIEHAYECRTLPRVA
jgi:hypothetical protein